MSDPPDVIVVAGLDPDELGFSAIDAVGFKQAWKGRKNIKLALRVNECDARKGTTHMDPALVGFSQKMDGTIFVSDWLRGYFKETWRCHDQTVIHNGVDKQLFNPYRKGLYLFDCARMRIVTHHWSNNQLKGFDIYDQLDRLADGDDFYRFHYIGRERGTFKGKNTIVTPPCHGEALAKALWTNQQALNVYVSASRFDPGPNHVLEALASGFIVLAHRDGGGSVEFAGADHTYGTFDELVTLINAPQVPNTYTPLTWEDSIKRYVSYLETLCKTK
jgi:glycosyltransferase involved in cell wall biosynthesis